MNWKERWEAVRKALTERGIVGERERERENKTPALVGGVREEEPFKPLLADITATERHYSRSVKIRRAIYAFMAENVGQPFRSWEDLQGGASLAAGCGMETARRWLITFSSEGGDFFVSEQPVGLVIQRREGGE
jgi:hypothetical protein